MSARGSACLVLASFLMTLGHSHQASADGQSPGQATAAALAAAVERPLTSERTPEGYRIVMMPDANLGPTHWDLWVALEPPEENSEEPDLPMALADLLAQSFREGDASPPDPIEVRPGHIRLRRNSEGPTTVDALRATLNRVRRTEGDAWTARLEGEPKPPVATSTLADYLSQRLPPEAFTLVVSSKRPTQLNSASRQPQSVQASPKSGGTARRWLRGPAPGAWKEQAALELAAEVLRTRTPAHLGVPRFERRRGGTALVWDGLPAASPVASASAAETACQHLTEAMRSDLITLEELSAAQTRVLTRWRSPDTTISADVWALGYGAAIAGDLNWHAHYGEALRQVGREDIQALCQGCEPLASP
ncbi:MAG: hypothetical protein VKP62_00350 [Candidatus Sericytochromatia bacterium]|nr:hypothetical protein [Candidatus Sericytochromatia bacterium]